MTPEQEHWQKHVFTINTQPNDAIKLWNGVPYYRRMAQKLNVDSDWLWHIKIVSPTFLRVLEDMYTEICEEHSRKEREMKLLFCPECCSIDISLTDDRERFRCNHCKEVFDDYTKDDKEVPNDKDKTK